MSIFGSILNSIFHHSTSAPAQASAPPGGVQQTQSTAAGYCDSSSARNRHDATANLRGSAASICWCRSGPYPACLEQGRRRQLADFDRRWSRLKFIRSKGAR